MGVAALVAILSAVSQAVASSPIAERKLTAIAGTGALTVITDNPGCIAHLRAILRKRGSPVQVLHIAELVAQRLAGMTNWRTGE